jgi:hypothetical protein
MQSPVHAELIEGFPEQAEGHERVTVFREVIYDEILTTVIRNNPSWMREKFPN